MGRDVGLGFSIALTLAATVGCGGATTGATRIGDGPPPASRDGGSDGGSMGMNDGGSDPPNFDPRSGTRLTVAPYSPDFVQAWDEKKNVACEPAPVSDGTERCLPSRMSPVMFSDPDCKHPLIQRSLQPDSCGTTATYFVDRGGPAGCLVPKSTVYAVGAELETPKELYNYNAGFCTSSTPSDPSQARYYEAVPMDPTEWVELTEEMIPVTTELAVVIRKGTDGSQLSKELRLIATGEACERYPREWEVPALPAWCIPTLRARRSSEYSDDQCTGARLVASCGPTKVAEPESGIPNAGLFETGTAVSDVYFSNFLEGDKCMLLSPDWKGGPNAANFYTLGPPLARDRYPVLELGMAGSGRIRTEYLASAGKNLVPLSLYDTEYETRCRAVQLSDGGTWCVPGALEFYADYTSVPFADSQCSRSLVEFAPPSITPPTTFRFALVFPPGHSCSPDVTPSLHSLVEHSGLIYDGGAGSCSSGRLPTPGSVYFAAGPKIDPSGVLAPAPPAP